MQFRPSILRTLSTQRRELEASASLAEISVTPELEVLISRMKNGELNPVPDGIWRVVFRASRPFFIRHLRNTVIMVSMFVISIWITKALLSHASDLTVVVLLAFGHLLSEIVRRSTNYLEVNNRAELSRAIQITLLSSVASKFTRLDSGVVGSQISKGNLKTLLSSDVESVEDFVTAATQSLSPTVLLILALSPTIWFLTGWAGLIAVGVAMLQIPISFLLALLIEKIVTKAQERLDSATTLLGEWIRNIRLVRYLGWQDHLANDIHKRMKSYVNYSALRKLSVCLTYAISYSWWMLSIIALLWFGKVLNQNIQTVDLFPSIWALTILMNWIQFIPRSIGLLGPAFAGAKRLEEFFSLPELLPEERKSAVLDENERPIAIHFQDVSLSIDSKTLLKDLSLTIPLYQHTAIVGSVGAGKSLFLELLLGERKPSRGKIEVEFQNGRRGNLWNEETYASYRSRIAWSAQTPFLSNATVTQNITLHGAESDAKILQASEKAELTPDIAGWPGGFKQEVGEVGINLSGGQKQRLSLARGFYAERPLWVLDDPLSAVDRDTESRLAKSFFREDTGVIIVSHRLDEIMRCHRVLVLSHGEITEDGPPDVLMMKENGDFRAFVEVGAHE